MLRKAFITIAALGAFVVPSHADDITEAFKRDALLWAYKSNGNSMSRFGAIDAAMIDQGKVDALGPARASVDILPPPAPKKR